MELTELKHAFPDCSWFLIGDFNTTLSNSDRNCGLLDRRYASKFQAFIDGCDLVEYPLRNHRFTWFRGGSMSRLDRSFAHTQCLSHFSSLKLIRLDHGLSDHYPMLVMKE
jgi:endonuclease/exonuclease/phosphatase family metal-dependent hydrolase